MVFVIAFIMLIQCAITCYRKRTYTVGLRLTDGREIVILSLIKLTGKTYHVHYTALADELRVRARIWSQVTIYWPSIQIVSMLNKHKFKTIEFQRTFYVNHKTAIKLQRILRRPFTCDAILIHKGNFTPIPMCTRDCQLIPQMTLHPSAPPSEGVRLSILPGQIP